MFRHLDVLSLRLRSLFKSKRVDDELDRELQDHLQHLIEENVTSGMSPRDARFAALRAFGNISVTKEESRDTRGTTMIENLLRDLRYSLRGLLHSPMLLVTAVISIALGAGGNIAGFSLARCARTGKLPQFVNAQIPALGVHFAFAGPPVVEGC